MTYTVSSGMLNCSMLYHSYSVELFVVLQQHPEHLLSSCAVERRRPASAAAYRVARLPPPARPSVFHLLAGPRESPPCRGGVVGERRAGTGGSGDRPDPGACGRHRWIQWGDVSHHPVGLRRRWKGTGRVKGTDGQASE